MKALFKNFILLSAVFATTLAAAVEPAKEVYLSEMAASGNDWLINQGQTHPLLKPLAWVTSRMMSVTLFPVCTALDMAVLTAKQVHEAPYILLSTDASQRQQHLAQFHKNAEALKKNSLGLLTAPIGIFSPDIITHHFVPAKIQATQVSPYGKLYGARAHVTYPQSIADVQAIIKEARAAGKSISIIGKGMSQGKQAISNTDWNVVINLSQLNQIHIDPTLKIAKIGAGALWQDLQRQANQYGLAVRVMQASNIFSIGGSISANCHGWDYKTGCLGNTLMGLTIVDANGKVLELTPKDPFFNYVVGGYGGFGVIVEAIISLTDNVKMLEKGIEIPPRDYVAYFNQNIRDNKEIEMHLYRLSLVPQNLFQTGIAVSYHRVNDQPVMANLQDEPVRGTRGDRIKLHTLRRLPWLRHLAWKVEKNEALVEKESSRNALMRPPINSVFNNSKVDAEWLQEYFVKGEDLADFLRFLGKILQDNQVALFNASVRFVKQDSKTMLSYAPTGERFAVVLFFNQNLAPKEIRKTKIWVRQVIDYLIAHEGTFYLPYQHFATLEQFKACYPNWKALAAYKQTIDPDAVFDNGLFADYITAPADQTSLFRQVFNRVDGQRQEIRDFLNHVFMQLDEEKFFALVDSILENPQLNDEQIYTILFQKIGQAQPNMIVKLQHTLKSLESLKRDLANQTAHLVGQRKVQGYVEIGYPGRLTRSLKNRLEMQGPFYAITDGEKLSDYIEAGFPRPYDHFIYLNDYAPISERVIPTNSVDLVCLYIGLHHIPIDKIDPFLASLKRIIRPGGSFILMDHHAHTKALQNLVNVVHSIFNVATGVTPEANQREIRNFQSLQYWKDRLEAHGMTLYKHKPLMRRGDPTLNAIVRFDKPLTEATPATIAESLQAQPEYNRTQMQTYLTAPEWQNVRAAQRYAMFVEKEPAYRYPYFSEIGGFWKVYGQAWQAAQKRNGLSAIALSEYNLMNLFVGASMTLEYGIKGLVAAPFALLDKAFGSPEKPVEAIPSAQERRRSLKSYGKFIENTPFYKYPYFKDISLYWSTCFKQNKSLSSYLKGILMGTGMTIEYGLKGLVSAPMSFFYGSEALKEAETIHLLMQDRENQLESIDPAIVVLETYPEHALKHVEIPRYMRFTEIMRKIAQHTCATCLNIAGHDKIQVDVRSPQPGIQTYAGTRKLYEIPAPTDNEYTYIALEVPVEQLCEVFRKVEQNKAEVLFIHDY
ncbi:MAG: hypothetical protein CK425_07710 [Parachlamydia sp.]|nr:MAG: hypothetical protein CK425_07710 [Parachlamydia sp.]